MISASTWRFWNRPTDHVISIEWLHTVQRILIKKRYKNNKYSRIRYKILYIAGVETGTKCKDVAGELYVNAPLLSILPAAHNHTAEWSQTTDPTGRART